MTVMRYTHGFEVCTSNEMKNFEKENFLRRKSYYFMEKAGYEAFKFISKKFTNKQPIIVLCGPGNNGGDGLVTARYLMGQNFQVDVYLYNNKGKLKGDALKAFKKFKGKVQPIKLFKLKKRTIIVDSLFGIGLNKNIDKKLAKLFIKVNKSKNKVIAIDIPSGICSNTGKMLGKAIKANFTVTFHRKKIGHLLNLGKEFSGKIKVVNIGFYKKKMITKCKENSPLLWLKLFPWKTKKGHKYSRGRVIIYGGQKEFTGATILSAESALRTGTGSVKIICSKDTLNIYSLKFPSSLKVEINNINKFEQFLKKEKITSILIGPGAGSNDQTKKIVKLILKKVKYVVLDADALTCFRNDLSSLYSLLDKNKIITPHLGEFHKIFPKIKKNLNNIDKAIEAVKLIKSNIVLKGPSSVIVSFDKKIVINDHDSSELAVIGSGDVLSGIIVSLIGKKKMNPFTAGCAATWLHGDVAKNYGKGLIAEDLVKGISQSLNRLQNGRFT